MRGVLLSYLLAALALSPAAARDPQDKGTAGSTAGVDKAAVKPGEKAAEKLSETRHTLNLPGGKLEYTATAGRLLLEEDGKPQAHVFFVAYTRAGVADPSARPITFAFN